MEGESSTENESPPRKEISRGGGAPSPLSLFSRDANENEEDEFNVIHLPPSPPPSPPAITPNITLRRKRTSIASHCVNLPTPRGTSLIRQASKACGGSFKNLHSASGSLENSISGIHDESILEEGGREGQFEADVEEGKEVKKEDGHITPSGPLLFEHFIVVGAPETAAVSRGQEILLKSSLSSSSSAQHSITTRMRMGFNYLLASASSSMDSSDNSSFPPVKSTDKADSNSSSFSQRPTTLSSQQKQRQRAAHINRKAPTSPSRHLYEPTDLSQSVDAELLFHYPPDADPPPAEVSEFCLPVGGCIDYIKPAEEETLIREIFYGQKQGHRSSRCFVFILEDHTAVPSSNPSSPLKTATSTAETPLASSIESPFVIDEVREEGGRLYGMCVVHSRLLRVPVDKNSITNNKQQRGWNLGPFGRKDSQSARRSSMSSENSDEDSIASTDDNVTFTCFESSVCYAFITKFPLFEFFFSVLTDLITLEKLNRMESMIQGRNSLSNNSTEENDLSNYSYVPESLLKEVLDRLTRIPPPTMNASLRFNVQENSMALIEIIRKEPLNGMPEHISNGMEWALPTLISWLPLDNIVWLLSMLMCEVKVVVLGSEAGMVSCVVMSLLALLQPLNWVAPLIPVLPLKYLDFVESPVPILAGIVVEGNEIHLTPDILLAKCDDVNCNSFTAVLDTNTCEIFMVAAHRASLPGLLMPGAKILIESITEGPIAKEVSERLEYTEHSGGRRVSVMTKMGSSLKPVYTVTEGCVAEAISVQKKISAHIEGVLTRAATFQDFSCTSDGRRSTGQGFPMSDTESVDENISEQMPVEPFLLPSAGMVKRRSDRGLRRSMAFSEQSSLSNGGAALTEGGSDSRPPSLRNLSVDTSSDCGGVRISLSFEQLESESDVMVVNAETGTVSDENAFLHRFRHTQTYFDYVNGSADDEDLEENDFVPFFDESILSMNPELSNLPSSLEASAAPPHEMLIRGKDFEDDANRHSRRSVSSGVFSIREVDEDNEEDDQITNCDDKSAGMPTAVPSSAPSAHSASSIRRTSMLRAPLSKRTSISLVATTNERFLDI